MRRPPVREEGPPVNERVLRFRDVRVIGAEGEQLGILQSRQALQLAREQGLDLVMVAPNAQPPVCKIIDHGKYKYQQEKLNKENRKVKQDVKGIKLRPGTAEHDLRVLVRNATKFLEEGHKVKVTCQFRAREVTHPEFGYQKMTKIAEELAAISTVEKAPSLDGKLMTMILLPKAGPKKKDAKDQDQQDGSKKVQGDRERQDHAQEVEQQSHVLPQERESETQTGTGT